MGVEGAALDRAAAALAAGAVVGIPTDTVYGLAVDATVAGATERLFALKQRPRGLALPVLVAGLDQARALSGELTPGARRLMDRCWPGALTVVVALDPDLDLDLDLGAAAGTVGLRCPDHPVPRRLAARVGALATTSANLHGQAPSTEAAALNAAFGDGVATVVDGGRCAGEASTVVDATGEELRLLRPGALAWADVLAALG